jgi:hypothetical protein
VKQVRGNKNPRSPEIRWFLGTAIKSRLRAGPYPATHKQKDAGPESKGGVAREEGEANEAHDCFAHDDGDDATGGHIGSVGPLYSPIPPTEEKFMMSVDIELRHSVEKEGLRKRLELDSRPEVIRLVGQCSILVVIAGIVAGLIAA